MTVRFTPWVECPVPKVEVDYLQGEGFKEPCLLLIYGHDRSGGEEYVAGREGRTGA